MFLADEYQLYQVLPHILLNRNRRSKKPAALQRTYQKQQL
jgi:hypothetical protein